MSTAPRPPSILPFLIGFLRQTGTAQAANFLGSGNRRIRTATAPAFMACLSLLAVLAPSTFGAAVTKQASGTDLTGVASPFAWSGGAGANGAPTASDVATWSSASLGSGLTLGTSKSWGSISVSGAAGDIGITGLGTLTVGAIGLTNVNMSIGNPIALSGSPTWSIGTSGKTLTVSGVISGSGQALTLDGTGTVLLSGANTYNQGTTINGGIVAFRNNTSGGPNFAITNGATLEFTNTSSQQIQGGTISGNGTLLKQSPSGTLTTATVLMLGGNGKPENIALTNGLIDVEGGTLRNEYANKSWTNNLAPMTVAAGAMFDVWDGYAQVDALNGYGTVNKGWSVNCSFVMGVNNGSGTFNGNILNNYTYSGYGASGGSLSIIKAGTGTQTLTGTNTWTGSTTISNGTLVIGGAGLLGGGAYAGAITNYGIFNYGSSANQTLSGVISGTGSLVVSGSGTLMLDGANTCTGATTINAGTLGGNGIINGPVTNAAGGTLQPGLGIGDTSTLTVSNNVVLAGTNYFSLNRTNAQNSSRLFASGTVSLGGTLRATNTGDALQAGDSFALFNAAAFNGNFSATNLPALGAGLAWTNTIGQNGTLSVFSTLPPTIAVVTNLPATQIFATSASLKGQVLSTGGQSPNVWIAYGANDGGTNINAWSNSISLGVKNNGAFSALAAGLATNTTYFFNAFASNSAGITGASPSSSFTTLAANPSATRVAMVTYHNDNSRQGQNTNETLLTLANVNTNTFGKLFTYAVDGQIYAQPLILTNVAISGQGVHNVVVVATENDTLYAFDADSNSGTNGGLLWSTSLGIASTNALSGYGTRYFSSGNYGNITTEVGTTGTPVIDPSTGTVYVDAFTRETTANSTNWIHRIHALDMTTGSERSYSPVVVAGSVPGVGRDSVGGVVTFNAVQQLQRPALTLAGGMLYVAYGSYADTDPYHGWIFGYNATNLTLQSNYIFNTTPNATTNAFGVNAAEGGIWQSGAGLCADTNNNLYFETGNGSFSANTNGGDYSDSFMKLSTTNGLAVADYFTPFDQANRAAVDTDLGSSGPMLLPDSAGSATHPHLLVGLDKGGKVFVLDRDAMASPHYQTSDNSQIVQYFSASGNGIFNSPTYFNGMIYVQPISSAMKQFAITNGIINTNAITNTPVSFGGSNGGPVASANGTNNGIIWVINSAGNPAVLYAFNATNISQMLYNSSQLASRDQPGNSVKFSTPTVAGGRVFVPAQYSLSVYGVQVFLDAPSISPNGGAFVTSTNIAISDASAGASIYYTLDGTTPTANSTLYTGPFTLTSNAVVQAVAIAPGSVNSAVASASFMNTAAAGNGTGLLAQYFTNATSVSPFNGSPVLVTTNSTVNFSSITNWPGTLVGTTNFTVRWTGSVQAQFNETYSFITTADDGARLYLNGQLLIDDWADKTNATSKTNSVSLVAQQYYSIELDYYQKTNSASVALSWSSPSTPFNVIPRTQLYPFTNPPPSVVITAPLTGASYTAKASVTVSADADAPNNPISAVSFYSNNAFLGSVSNLPYALTATGLGAGSYNLSAVATDGSGLSSTSAVVTVTVNAGSGLPYGLTNNAPVKTFLNMPAVSSGSLPALISLTGVFSNTPAMIATNGLIPYDVNTPLWSDGALKTRYIALPNHGSPLTPDEQISFDPNNPWSFPAGTVFVKTFELNTDTTNPNVRRRLETRLLVRDINGAVYGVTYKWRADNSDADLLSSSLSEAITITNASGTTTQTWYYPSPSDCLICHTPVSGGVLGVNARQLNRNLTYAATGVADNELRTLNRLGLFNPAFDESAIATYPQLAALTNLSASLEQRARSYFDANCSQCHQPGGTGITFDARYTTPLANQNLINGGLDENGFAMIVPKDLWRSEIPPRMDTTDPAVRMPPLGRNLVDTNALQVITDWINSLPGTPAQAPPSIAPNGGSYFNSIAVAVAAPDTNAVIYYTLDGSTPTTNSFLYVAPFNVTTNATVAASAFRTNYINSASATAVFYITPVQFTSANFGTNRQFQLNFLGVPGSNYVLQASTNLLNWNPISTNTATTNAFLLFDPAATNYPQRFYRVLQQ